MSACCDAYTKSVVYFATITNLLAGPSLVIFVICLVSGANARDDFGKEICMFLTGVGCVWGGALLLIGIIKEDEEYILLSPLINITGLLWVTIESIKMVNEAPIWQTVLGVLAVILIYYVQYCTYSYYQSMARKKLNVGAGANQMTHVNSDKSTKCATTKEETFGKASGQIY